ncbi:MAG: pitrilysin family protein, partial [Pseudomonadota bacterium]
AYFQRIASDRLDMVMRMEADRMTDLAFSEAQALTELDVVLEERALRTDTSPGALFAEQRSAALFLNHPYGDPLVGWRHEMEGLSREDALAFYRAHYAPENAILVVAGDVTPDGVRDLAERHYGPIPRGGRVPARARPTEPPHTAARRVIYEDARVRQPYVTREWLAPSRRVDQRRAAALAALGGVLGDGISSVLTRELVTARGLAVAAGAAYSGSARDYGRFTVYATPKPGVTLQALEAALDEVLADFLAGDGPDRDRLDRFKSQWRAAYIYAQDSQVSLAQRYGAGLAGDLTLEQIEGWPDDLQAVSVDDVMDAARTLLRPEAAVTGWLRAPAEEGGEG